MHTLNRPASLIRDTRSLVNLVRNPKAFGCKILQQKISSEYLDIAVVMIKTCVPNQTAALFP